MHNGTGLSRMMKTNEGAKRGIMSDAIRFYGIVDSMMKGRASSPTS